MKRTDWLEVAVIVLLVGMILAARVPARGADDDRARRAKVALALAAPGEPRADTLAPAPRAAGRPRAKDYPAAYRESLADQRPLVVFVGTDPPAPVAGAVVAKVEAAEFAGARAPAVVVAYPAGGRVVVDATLPATVDPGELERVVRTAGKKIENITPARMPAAPPPLDWMILAEPAAEAGDGRPRLWGLTPPEPRWHADYAAARAGAKKLDRPLLVVIGTADCYHCRRLEAGPLRDAAVVELCRGFVCVKIDADAEPELAKAFGAKAYPTVVLGGPGDSVHSFTEGYVEADKLAGLMKQAAAKVKRRD